MKEVEGLEVAGVGVAHNTLSHPSSFASQLVALSQDGKERRIRRELGW